MSLEEELKIEIKERHDAWIKKAGEGLI